MTRAEIDATNDAIEILRASLKRLKDGNKHGVCLDASVPLWSAANYLFRSLPIEER